VEIENQIDEDGKNLWLRHDEDRVATQKPALRYCNNERTSGPSESFVSE
jgi:hypothetical protein